MLPSHASRRPPHLVISIPTRGTTSRSNSRLSAFIGRPLLRWIPILIGSILTLWLFSSMLFRTNRPFREYTPDRHSVVEGSSNRHRPYHPPRPPNHQGPTTVWSNRADRVRDAFVHAWSGYQKYAAGYDELEPVSSGRVNNFNGWGVTLFDSLDTMWIMGLHNTFRESLGTVAKSTFTLKQESYAPFFETVIRYLGGLLAAYSLSGEPVLLSRADDLGKMLLPAFNTTSGFPIYAVNTVSGKTRSGWSGYVLWSEAISNQMEYKYLAHLTGRTDYFNKTEAVMQKMYTANITDGLFPTSWDIETGTPSSTHYSVGAFADSAHEYLLKQWLLTAKSEPQTLRLYLQSINAVINNLLYITPTRNLLYVTDMESGRPTHKFEHLSCFLPGLIALGVNTLETHLSPRDRELHSWAAHGLAYTCWVTYKDQATGLGPDEMQMVHGGERWLKELEKWEKGGKEGDVPGLGEVKKQSGEKRDYSAIKPGYLLRPETIESFYILWRTTKDERWRERGWAIFESIEKIARTKYGYASVNDVDQLPPTLKDEMPSYFMAETLKYLFLLFTDDDILPLKDWVFNTEAHPLPVFEWSNWEKEEYNIPV